ncbi:OmpA family protein [Kangiella sp. TOML190]|uniref:OmpA family protein n=1 Tax=Kangiella sp. TOML190 TaxID=2931351 RepID=UPI00203C81A4|nr:OmpA family protein [Kangiella sp. TOML190]
MKKLILGACLLSASTLGFAEEGEVKDRSGAYGMISLVQTQFDLARNLKDQDSTGLSIGWMLNKNWAIEGTYTYLDDVNKFPSNFEPGSGVSDIETYGLDFIYNDTHWLGNTTTSPFLKFGMGKHNVTTDHPWLFPSQIEEDEFIKLGVGIQHFASKHAFIRAGVDFLDGDEDLGDDRHFYFGVGYFFGSTHYDSPAKVEQPKQAPKDSDGDGVMDADDRCPGTPAGAKVDAYGCPVDSDGDGVYDYQDACPNTPAGAKVDEKGCQVKAEKVVVDMRLNFDTNMYAIKPEMVSEIAKVAEFLRQFPNVEAQIQGHTDSVGSSNYNQGLSERRANSVVDYLASNFGIDKARLTGVGYGEERPIADNATAEGRALNRRAEANLESK